MKNFRILLTATFLFLGLSHTTAASAAQGTQQLSTLENNFSEAFESLNNTRRAIVTQASDAIEKLSKDASDSDLRPIISALSVAAAYDPGNETGQTAYILVNRFGRKRIVRLIQNTPKPSFLMIGLSSVQNESKDQ